MATDADLDASVRRVLAGLLAGGDPYTAMPLVDPVTKLLPPETVEAIRAPLAGSLTELGADLDTVTETVGEHSAELATRLSEQALKATMVQKGSAGSHATRTREQVVSGGLLLASTTEQPNVLRILTESNQSDPEWTTETSYRGKGIIRDLATPWAKAMDEWRIPIKPGTAVNGIGFPYDWDDDDLWDRPLSEYKPVAWAGAHYLNQEDNKTPWSHGHWSVEVPDAAGSLRTRFQVTFMDDVTGEVGVNRSKVKVSSADFIVQLSMNARVTVSSPDAKTTGGTSAVIALGLGDSAAERRWDMRMHASNQSAPAGGMPFQLRRYDNDGTLLGISLEITRSSGDIALRGRTAIYSDHARPFEVYTGGGTSRASVDTWGKLTLAAGIDFSGTDVALRAGGTTEHIRLTGETRNIGLFASTSFAGGEGVLGIRNATTAPAGTPASGVVVFADGGVLKVKTAAGYTVQLARQSAIADATDAASVITQLNAALAALRTIGLIANS